jgi:hypothetical protein
MARGDVGGERTDLNFFIFGYHPTAYATLCYRRVQI